MCTFLTFSYLLFLAGKRKRVKSDPRYSIHIYICAYYWRMFSDFDEGPGEYPFIHLLARGYVASEVVDRAEWE